MPEFKIINRENMLTNTNTDLIGDVTLSYWERRARAHARTHTHTHTQAHDVMNHFFFAAGTWDE
jgi:hypothetical protein